MKRKSFTCIMLIIGLIIVLSGCGNNEEKAISEEAVILTGNFSDGPVQGLQYESRTFSGMTNEDGEFTYQEGETITFSVGGLVLGSVLASNRLTPAHLVTSVGGDVEKITNQIATNMARFLQSLDMDANIENGVTITEQITNVVDKYQGNIDFNQTEVSFTGDQNIVQLFSELNLTLRTAEQARNHLRRTLLGVKKLQDVKIPTRDGAYVVGDIFRPIEDGKFPVIMSFGGWGKAFYRACICNDEEALAREVMEDKFFEGNPFNQAEEVHETPDFATWVPKGYVVMRVDSRGLCDSPFTFSQFTLQEAEDFYDAIEWAGVQSWSNGNVGTFGQSYYAMTGANVAQLQPPHLKALVLTATDVDSYRDVIYSGDGMYNTFNRITFLSEGSLPVPPGKYTTHCGTTNYIDWIEAVKSRPFDDPSYYGPEGSGQISPDLSKVTQPILVDMPQEHSSHIHVSGSSEAYIGAASKNKKLNVITGDFIAGWAYTPEATADYERFYDYWLKDKKDNGWIDRPAVKMAVRTGNGGYIWQDAEDWPVPGTQYTKYYLDAISSSWVGDGKTHKFMQFNPTEAATENVASYSADVGQKPDVCWDNGVSFITEPLPEDITLAGYMKLVLWVSSTSSDMDIHASVRVIDGTSNKEIPYALSPRAGDYPIGLGWLKVSHRVLDPEKSTDYRPWHTHTAEDYAPLEDRNPVQVEVRMWPGTALIKAGNRIRLDIQPAWGCGHGSVMSYDPSYHVDASNSIYTGPKHVSYLQVPVIPNK